MNPSGMMLEKTPQADNEIQNNQGRQNLDFNFNVSLANHNWQSQLKDATVLMSQLNQDGEG